MKKKHIQKPTPRTLIQKFTVFLTFLSAQTMFYAQCPSGAIGVTGSGCGCLSGCNLTSFGGPNCSPSVTGNCSGGELSMSVLIPVPAGCTYTVSAQMMNRSSCSASGADSGDKMKVDMDGGGKSYQTGSGNATLTDSYTLTGPGTIEVSGTANRADEIITYSTVSTPSPTCTNCISALPIELLAFDVSQENDAVACYWSTESETNNDYFTVERSEDGVHYVPIAYMDGKMQSYSVIQYKIYDYSPIMNETSYYRLVQTDKDGHQYTTPPRAIYVESTNPVIISPNPSRGNVQIRTSKAILETLTILDAAGRMVQLPEISPGNELILTDLPGGVYSVIYQTRQGIQTEKIVMLR